MKTRRSRYRTGSIRKLVHSTGAFSWEFRYYATSPDGTRKSCSESFPGHLYPTQKAVRDAVQDALSAMNANSLEEKSNATLNTILERYIKDELPSLQLSTQETHTGTIENYVRRRWGEIKLSRIRAMDVKVWLDGLKIGPASKTRIRNMISIMFDRAMLWEYIPVNRNPMKLVRVKGSAVQINKEPPAMGRKKHERQCERKFRHENYPTALHHAMQLDKGKQRSLRQFVCPIFCVRSYFICPRRILFLNVQPARWHGSVGWIISF